MTTNQPPAAPSAANRLGIDYRAEASRFLPIDDLGGPIVDVHSHINGDRAARIYAKARELYGVGLTYSMSQFDHAETVQRNLGDTIRFIAVPDFGAADKADAFAGGYITRMTEWHALGARMCKFWVAPRGRDFGKEMGDPLLMTLESPWRRKQMDHGASLGMMFMAHVADPDTWFGTKYADSSFYGTKADQYEPLERLVEEYRSIPWILAHMGGWPEDLDFLSGLLDRHANLNLDTSACKWMVRELSKHPSQEFVAFLRRYQGRVLFGSDIVSSEIHVGGDAPTGSRAPNSDVASEDEAFDLYASRYWALRTLFETDYDGESPIADPDLMLVDPAKHDEMSAPALRGHSVPSDIMRSVYRDAAGDLLNAWYEGRWSAPA